MKYTFVLLLLLVCVTFTFAANNNCFVLGVEGTTPFPPVGYSSVSLDLLKGARGADFLAQYNTYGINFVSQSHLLHQHNIDKDYISNNLVATNCLATLGMYQCVYPGTDSADFLVPFTSSGSRQCVWDNPPSPVKLGTWNTNTFYNTLNQSVFSNWSIITCPTTNFHYTLLYNNTCGGSPTPPPVGVECCYYFSHPLNYQSLLCQKKGSQCPDVQGYIPVWNQTANSCSQCPEAIEKIPGGKLSKD